MYACMFISNFSVKIITSNLFMGFMAKLRNLRSLCNHVERSKITVY